jgi:hypothetical protein
MSGAKSDGQQTFFAALKDATSPTAHGTQIGSSSTKGEQRGTKKFSDLHAPVGRPDKSAHSKATESQSRTKVQSQPLSSLPVPDLKTALTPKQDKAEPILNLATTTDALALTQTNASETNQDEAKLSSTDESYGSDDDGTFSVSSATTPSANANLIGDLLLQMPSIAQLERPSTTAPSAISFRQPTQATAETKHSATEDAAQVYSTSVSSAAMLNGALFAPEELTVGKSTSGAHSQSGDVTALRQDVSNDRHENRPAEGQTGRSVPTEANQVVVPVSTDSAFPAAVFPDADQVSPTNTKGSSIKTAVDRSKATGAPSSATQETAAFIRKNGDPLAYPTNIGTTKTQSRKDDLVPSESIKTADVKSVLFPKGFDLASSSTLASQASQLTADQKTASTSTLPKANDVETSELERESTRAANGTSLPGTLSGYPSSIFNTAKLMSRIGESELHLGVRAGEFGSVDIRTSMVRNQLTAEISVERGELGRAMAAELSNLQDRLSEQRVPVVNLTFQNLHGSDSTPPDQQQSRSGQQAPLATSVSRRSEEVTPGAAVFEGSQATSRLDIHM